MSVLHYYLWDYYYGKDFSTGCQKQEKWKVSYLGWMSLPIMDEVSFFSSISSMFVYYFQNSQINSFHFPLYAFIMIFLSTVGHFRAQFIITYSQMLEPLSLKSQPGPISEQKRRNLLTASQLMLKFSLKSPSGRICLTERDNHTARSTSTPRVQKQEVNLFKKVKDKTVCMATQDPMRREEKRKMDGSVSSCREKLVKLVNHSKKKEKREKILVLPLHKMAKGKQNYKCPTERSTPTSALSSNFKFNICLDKKASIPLAVRNSNEQNINRKGSDASTLSLKTKHTASMQHLDEDNDLFHRKSSQQLESDHKGSENILKALNETKRKLYQHLYSLDRKLLDDYQEEKVEAGVNVKKNKQTITISLRKKEEPSPVLSCL